MAVASRQWRETGHKGTATRDLVIVQRPHRGQRILSQIDIPKPVLDLELRV